MGMTSVDSDDSFVTALHTEPYCCLPTSTVRKMAHLEGGCPLGCLLWGWRMWRKQICARCFCQNTPPLTSEQNTAFLRTWKSFSQVYQSLKCHSSGLTHKSTVQTVHIVSKRGCVAYTSRHERIQWHFCLKKFYQMRSRLGTQGGQLVLCEARNGMCLKSKHVAS